MADQKISQDPELTTPQDTDYIPILDMSGATPVNKRVSKFNLLAVISGLLTTLTNNFNNGNFTGSIHVQGAGTFSETTTVGGVHVGFLTNNNPLIVFANGNAAQNWEMDNNLGTFRIYQVGASRFQITSTGAMSNVGYARIGSTSAPTNTTAGDLTFVRGFITGSLFVGGQTVPTSTLQSGGSFGLPIVAKSANYSVGSNDHTIVASGSGTTITLPTPVGITGRIYVVKRVDGSNTITVATAAGQIDGASTVSLGSNYQSVRVQSDGANWNVI